VYQRIKTALTKFYEGLGWTVSDRYELEPNLGIDLVCSKITKVKKTKREPEGRVKEQTFVLIGSKVSKPYEIKLLFYQFYLSIDISSGELQIIFAIPYAKAIKEKEKKFFEQNSIGLFLLKKNDNGTMKIIEEVPPRTLRKRMENDIEEMIDDLSKHYKEEEEELGLYPLEEKDFEVLKQQKEIIAVLADKFIEDALGGIVGLTKVSPKKFEKKYLIEFGKKFLDTKLLELISDVEKNKNIPYGKKLVQKIDEQCFEKKDEFDFSYDVFCDLWKQCFKRDYSKRLKINEPVLKYFFPKYRDHFIHQFQDFLFGLIIINKLVKDNVKELSKAWLLASSLHDFSYPIQKYDDIVQKLISDYFPPDMSLGIFALKDKYMEKELYSYAEYFIEYISKSFSKEFRNKGTEGINKIREFIYRIITEKRNHGAISYLALLTKFENEKKQSKLFRDIVLPAGVGIFLHDDEIWKPLCGMEVEDNHKMSCVRYIKELKPLPEINFRKHPLAFLMILVDNIQDWGRHYIYEKYELGAKAADISLKDILVDSKKVQIQLYFSRTKGGLSFMNNKNEVLNKICNEYLKSQDINFLIEYWDRDSNEETEFTFQIKG